MLGSLPEIVNLVGEEYVEELLKDHTDAKDVKAALRLVFTQLMSAKQDAVSEAVLKMKNRLMNEKQVEISSLISWLHVQTARHFIMFIVSYYCGEVPTTNLL